MQPRPYQQEAIDAAISALREGYNPVLQLATGTGKSLIIAALCDLQQRTGRRAWMLTHVQQLVKQNAATYARYSNTTPAIVCASLGRKDTWGDVTYGTIQSVTSMLDVLAPPDLIVIDEAHRVPHNEGEPTLYQSVLERYPEARRIAMTATPWRMDNGIIYGEGNQFWFDKLAYSYNVTRAAADGWLCPLVGVETEIQLNVEDITVNGDFVQAEVEAAQTKAWLKTVARSIQTNAAKRNHIGVYCPTVKSAKTIAEIIYRETGWTVAVLHSGLSQDERNAVLDQFMSGEVRVLCSVDMITTGFDFPALDCIVCLRPTLSSSLWVQIQGRGTRLHPSKKNCIAEGQRVLTDNGLIPIEQITTDMKVWDGVDFVAHCGAILRGEKEIITYAGLTATPDHHVWTAEGWKTLGQCAVEQAAIAVTGDGGLPIREAESRFRKGCPKESGGEAASVDGVRWLRGKVAQGLHQRDERESGVPGVRPSAPSAEVACGAGHLGETALHEPKRQQLCEVWRARHSVYLCDPDTNGVMGPKEPWPASSSGTGSYQQRGPLRAWKSALLDTRAEPCPHKEARIERATSQVPATASGCEVCGRDVEAIAGRGIELPADSATVSAKVMQTKRRVWDILNAGPFHRFTVEGLLVHNCLVLDYVGNLIRLGGVDMYETHYRESGLVEVSSTPRQPYVKKERKVYPGLKTLKPIDPMTGQEAVDGSEIEVSVHNVNCVAITPRGKTDPILLVQYACTTEEGARIDASIFLNTLRPDSKTLEFFSNRMLAVRLPAPAKSLSWQLKSARKPETLVVRKKGKYWNVVGENWG